MHLCAKNKRNQNHLGGCRNFCSVKVSKSAVSIAGSWKTTTTGRQHRVDIDLVSTLQLRHGTSLVALTNHYAILLCMVIFISFIPSYMVL